MRAALVTLQKAGLVLVPQAQGARGRYSNLVLLNESGVESTGEPEEYTVPKPDTRVVVLPSGFITNGWVHVLEDSEIALLLMVASHEGGWLEGGYAVVPAAVRLLNYGIHRDPYSTARKTLEWFGLIDVEEVGRHDDGRAEDDERMVHRIRLRVDQFERPGLDLMQEALSSQISR
ncbi:hypothetical protein CQ045_09560 [Microbacterium sp. MYb66]|nr:hypothetical protein CQ045_09560 [Microbacterium sp. MYb66]